MDSATLYERITNPTRIENGVRLELPTGDESVPQLLLALGFASLRDDGTCDYAILTKRMTVTENGFTIELSNRQHDRLTMALGMVQGMEMMNTLARRVSHPAVGIRATTAAPVTASVVVINEQQQWQRIQKLSTWRKSLSKRRWKLERLQKSVKRLAADLAEEEKEWESAATDALGGELI